MGLLFEQRYVYAMIMALQHSRCGQTLVTAYLVEINETILGEWVVVSRGDDMLVTYVVVEEILVYM